MKYFKIKKSEQLKPTTPKPSTQPANGYQWSWNIDTAQWEQVPINSQYSYNITDDKNAINTSNTQYTTQTTGYTTTTAALEESEKDETIKCLNQFVNVDDFDDGILFVNGLEYKPKAKLYEDGLVEYGGYCVVRGPIVRITTKGLLFLKSEAEKENNIVKARIDLDKQIDDDIDTIVNEINKVPTTIQGLDFPVKGISPYEPVYDNDNKRFAKKNKNDNELISAEDMNHIISDILEENYLDEIQEAYANEDLDRKLKEILINEGIKINDTTLGRIVEHFDVYFL